MSQLRRWCFTYNNYELCVNYVNYLQRSEFNIRRAIFGYEIAVETGTRHIQGYIEFKRSYRFGHLKRIFRTAHWEGAKGTSIENFTYCTKEGCHEKLGNWDKEETGNIEANRNVSVGTVIKYLLTDEAPIVKCSKEYSMKPLYFDMVSDYVFQIGNVRELYDEWKVKNLSSWQYSILSRLLQQDKRKVLWIYDEHGNSGKSFLANYLNILYSFTLLDGTITTRDICQLIPREPEGFCFDVSRATENRFDYDVLECLKNGYVVSGKYQGLMRRFKSVPVIVFSNYMPNKTQLSTDRWDVIKLHEDEYANIDTTPINNSPSQVFPFKIPPKTPILEENFCLKNYLAGITDPLITNSGTIPRTQQHAEIYVETRVTVPIAGPSSSSQVGETKNQNNVQEENFADASTSHAMVIPVEQETFTSKAAKQFVSLKEKTPTVYNSQGSLKSTQSASTCPEQDTQFRVCPFHRDLDSSRKGCICLRKKSRTI